MNGPLVNPGWPSRSARQLMEPMNTREPGLEQPARQDEPRCSRGQPGSDVELRLGLARHEVAVASSVSADKAWPSSRWSTSVGDSATKLTPGLPRMLLA